MKKLLIIPTALLFIGCGGSEDSGNSSTTTSKPKEVGVENPQTVCECAFYLDPVFKVATDNPETFEYALQAGEGSVPNFKACGETIMTRLLVTDLEGLDTMSIDDRMNTVMEHLQSREDCGSWKSLVASYSKYFRFKLEEAKEVAKWESRFYVDDFGDPTEEGYVTRDITDGSFSNSAATNAGLSARLLIEPDVFDIKLFEYNSSEVKAYSTDFYKVRLKYGSELADFEAKNYGDRLTFKESDARKIIDIVDANETIKFSIVEKSKYGSPSKYNFVIMYGQGLKEELSKFQ